MKVWHRLMRRDHNERGNEMVAAIFVVPVLVILVLGLIDVGMMFRSRALVENVTRDTVRNIAAEGGNLNLPARGSSNTQAWDTWLTDQMYDSGTHTCKLGNCLDGEKPTATCDMVTTPPSVPPSSDTTGTVSYHSNIVLHAGDIVTCHVTYPYKAINKGLWDSPIGLGMGSLIKPFNYYVSARSETGCMSYFGGSTNTSRC